MRFRKTRGWMLAASEDRNHYYYGASLPWMRAFTLRYTDVIQRVSDAESWMHHNVNLSVPILKLWRDADGRRDMLRFLRQNLPGY